MLNLAKLKKYLGSEERPVSGEEFKDFWESLSDAEKEEIKATDVTYQAHLLK